MDMDGLLIGHPVLKDIFSFSTEYAWVVEGIVRSGVPLS